MSDNSRYDEIVAKAHKYMQDNADFSPVHAVIIANAADYEAIHEGLKRIDPRLSRNIAMIGGLTTYITTWSDDASVFSFGGHGFTL